jgi:molecular chaperone DnaK
MFQIEFDGIGDNKPDTVVGIDLGTTNSLVAFMNLTKPEVIPGEDGDKMVPSVVSITPDGDAIVGNAARQELIDHPARTVYSVKRLMGRGIADVQDELKLFPFRIAEGSESVIRLALGEKTLTPPEVSALILRQLKKNAEAALGMPVTKAVITVPAPVSKFCGWSMSQPQLRSPMASTSGAKASSRFTISAAARSTSPF